MADKFRLIILADMGNEPDEEQQMVHMLMCSNTFDLDGLIAVTGKYLRTDPLPGLFHQLIDGYEQVIDNLKLHADGWHTPEYLRSITCAGQDAYGMDAVGDGKSSAGSQRIIDAVTADDPRPVYIVINAGSNTLAQALHDYRANHSPEEIDNFVAKLRVFENGAQDNAGAWICNQFPNIHWIRSNYQTYCYGGPGRGEIGPHKWEPYEYSPVGQHHWTLQHIQANHGPLGSRYPLRLFPKGQLGFMEGGGTTPWLGLLHPGFTNIDQPSWGGWSGRFTSQKESEVWSRHDDITPDEEKCTPFRMFKEVSDAWTDPETGTHYDNDYVPVWRWRRAMYNNIQCRMDWCLNAFEEANHPPQAVFNGNTDNSIVYLTDSSSETLSLDASKSTDPDGDTLSFSWWIYSEAGTYPNTIPIANRDQAIASLTIPDDASQTQIHLILEVKDNNPIASLYDYRRIVIDIT